MLKNLRQELGKVRCQLADLTTDLQIALLEQKSEQEIKVIKEAIVNLRKVRDELFIKVNTLGGSFYADDYWSRHSR